MKTTITWLGSSVAARTVDHARELLHSLNMDRSIMDRTARLVRRRGRSNAMRWRPEAALSMQVVFSWKHVPGYA